MHRSMILGMGLLSLLAAGCSKVESVSPPASGVDLRTLKSVTVAVRDDVGNADSKQDIPSLEGLLKGKLKGMGHAVVDKGADMLVEVRVTKLTAGSRSKRFWVGFGAGKAAIAFDTRFLDRQGRLLAEFHGEKTSTGDSADNPITASAEETRAHLVEAAVLQITGFIQRNGAS